MTALNGGGYGPAPRTVVLEMLRLAIDPTSGKRGAAWASHWASAGSPALNSYDFQQACEALEQMFATGVPPHDPSTPEPTTTVTAAPEPPPPPVQSNDSYGFSASFSPSNFSPPQQQQPIDSFSTVTPQQQPISSFSNQALGASGNPFPAQQPQPSNPFPPSPVAPPADNTPFTPPYNDTEKEQYHMLFNTINGGMPASRQQAAPTLARAQLSSSDTDIIWALCDLDADGQLDAEEFTLALHLAASRFKGTPVPEIIPREWLSMEKRSQLDGRPPSASSVPASPFGGGGGGFGGNGGGGGGAAADDGDDDLQVAGKQKKGGLFGRGKSKAAKPQKGGGAPPAWGSDAWVQQGQQQQPAEAPSFATSQQSFGFGDPNAKISISMGKTKAPSSASSQPEPQVDPISVHRSGELKTTAGSGSGKTKPKWIVLGGGMLAIYSDKKDATAAKPPKCTINIRTDVGRINCDTLNTFKVTLSGEVKESKGGKGKTMHKAGDALMFSSEDSKELTGWANDLMAVWKASQ